MDKLNQQKLFATLALSLTLVGCSGGSNVATANTANSSSTNMQVSAQAKDDAAGIDTTINNLVAVGTYGYAANVDAKNILTTSLYPKVNYTSVAYGNGRYIAVGEAGQIISSLDGNTWMTEATTTTQKLNSVSFDGSVFIATGNAGVILQSKDGATWDNSLSSKTAFPFNSVVGDGNGNFIAVGNNGVIYSTKAGARITSPTSLAFNSITYANGTYVAGGANGVLIASSDGFSWKLLKSPITSNIKNIKFANGSFIAVGDLGAMLISDNGYDWKDISIHSHFGYTDIAANPQDKSYMLIGTNTKYALIGSSYDLSTWSFYQGLTTAYLVNSVTCGEMNCVIVGNRGMNLSSDNNGKSWNLLKTGTEYSLQSAANNGKITVAVGNNGVIMVSNDKGLTWEVSAVGSGNYTLLDVKYLKDYFYAVGTNGTLLRSNDGYKWETLKSGVTSTLRSIIFTDKIIVTTRARAYPFMIVGDSGVVLASSDGTTWVTQASETKNNLRDAVYNTDDSSFYVVGASATMLKMDNGIKSNKVSIETPVKGLTANLNNIATSSLTKNKKTQQVMNVVGANGTVLSYIDKKWASVNCETSNELIAQVANNGSFYSSGTAGTLVKIDPTTETASCSKVNSYTNLSILGLAAIVNN